MNMTKLSVCALLAVGLTASVWAAEAKSQLQAAGVVEPRHRVKVGARATGVVDSIAVEEGAAVKEGDILGKLDDEFEHYRLVENQALEKLWQGKAERFKGLNNVESIDRIQENVQQAEIAAARVKQVTKLLEDKKFRAPLSGIVTRRFKHKGESVEEREDVFEIIHVDTVFFLAYFDAKDYARIQVGQAAAVTLDEGTEKFDGKVYFVDPAVDAGSGQFRVRVLLENPDRRITAGLKGNVTIGEGAGRVATNR